MDQLNQLHLSLLQTDDAFIVIDGNTTKQIPASDLTSYVSAGDITAVQAGVGLSRWFIRY